ncbi:MAG: DUF1801 domain-containing protein [Povalibacter sp.]
MTPFKNTEVAEVFASQPARIRKRLMQVRELIFDVAASTAGVGKIEETLKWGDPAYLTVESGSGSTIRINRCRSSEHEYAVFFHCQTTLIETFRTLFPDTFRFEGNRSIVFDERERIPQRELELCIAAALTYHSQKKASGVSSPRFRSVAARGSTARR